MTVGNWLKLAEKKLRQAGIGTARLDALVLAEDAIGGDRAYLLAHPELNLTDPIYHKLERQIRQRAQHAPLAYIRGKTQFYGRDFVITKAVLEPRPESETMIDLLKSVAGLPFHIVDVGTGSGALAVTAKLEVPAAKVSAIDIDPNCLKVTCRNAKQHKVDIDIRQGNLLEPLATRQLANSPTILLCNLPYVPDKFTINPAAMREPKIAIFGGQDGLDYYWQLFKQINDLELDARYVLTESMPPQHPRLGEIAERHDYKQIKVDDFIQVFSKL